MCHWIPIVSQLIFKCCYFDFVYCDFDVDHLVFEIQISLYCHLFLSANVRHTQLAMRLPQTTNRKNKTCETNLETQSKAYLLTCHSGLQDVVLKHKPVK